MAGEPAAEARLEPAGLEVALVVDDEDRVRLELEERRRGLDRAAGLVHVRLGLRAAPTRCPSIRTSASRPVELAAPRAAVPPRELVDDHVADVVAVPRVLAARVAEPDDEQVERRGAFAPSPGQAHGGYSSDSDSPPPLVGGSAGSASSAGLGLGALLALGAFLGLLELLLARELDASRCTVSSGSSRSVTPSRAPRSRTAGASRRCRARRRRPRGAAGTSSGSASTLTSFVTCVEDAALLDADRLADERDRDRGLDRLVEPHLLEVDVRDRAAHLVALVVLEDRRVRASRRRSRRRARRAMPAGGRQRGPQLALADRDRDRRRRGRRGRPGISPCLRRRRDSADPSLFRCKTASLTRSPATGGRLYLTGSGSMPQPHPTAASTDAASIGAHSA